MRFDTLDGVEVLNNQVLIKLMKGHDVVTLPNGKAFGLDLSFDEGRYINVLGIVAVIPEGLTYGNTEMMDELQWETTIEIQKGDIVCFYYLIAANAFYEHDPRYIIVDEEMYILVPYEKIFTAKRPIELLPGEDISDRKDIIKEKVPSEVIWGAFDYNYFEVIMLNGYLLVDVIPEEILKTQMLLPQSRKELNVMDGYYGIVKFTGSLNGKYLNYPDWKDEDNIRPGDKVIYDGFCALPIENKILARFDVENDVYYRMMRKNIAAKIHFNDG